jgi:hypothetical protein
MTKTEPTKVCPLCAETIKAKAKVCPHCRKVQKRWLFCSRYDAVAFASAFVFIGTVYLLGNMFIEGRNFSSSRDKIAVLNSQVGIESSSEQTNVVVTGLLTNRSDYAWRTGEFEVRFLDASGKIADVDFRSDGFTVMPHNDHSFSLTLYSRKSIPEHTSRKITIRSASDPDAWFSGD